MRPNSSQTPNDRSTSEPTTDRRSILTTTAGATAGSLGGCLGILPGNDSTPTDTGGGDGSDDGTPTGPTAPAWTEWAYPRGFRDPAGPYNLRYFDTDRIIANRDQLMGGFPGYTERTMVDADVYLGDVVSLEDVTSMINVDENIVFNGPWSKSEAEGSIAAFKGTTEAGSKGEYTLYEVADDSMALAVTDGQFVVGRLAGQANNLEQAMPVLEAVLEAKAGERERYADADTDFARTMEGATGDGGFYHQAAFFDRREESNYDVGEIIGTTMKRTTWALEGGTVSGSIVYVFASEEVASEEQVNGYVENSINVSTWTDLEVTQESARVFRIDGTVET